MNNKINFKIGVVKDFDGYSGKIVTPDKIYYFFRSDIIESIEKDDIVNFQGKTENTFPQAYFVKKYIHRKTK